MFGAFILIYMLLGVGCKASNERFEDQLNSARKDIIYLYDDVSKLSRSVENINKTIWAENVNGLGAGNNKKGDEEKRSEIDASEEQKNMASSSEILRLLEAFESEKRMNRELRNQINKLQDRMVATENRNADFEQALESESKLNQQCQTRLHVLEEKSSNIEAILDSKRRINEKSSKRLQTLEDKISDNGILNLEQQDRLEAIENRNIDIMKSIESNNQNKSEVMDRFDVLEKRDSDFKKELEVGKELNKNLQAQVDRVGLIIDEMVQNMTALMGCCDPEGKTSSSVSKGSRSTTAPVSETTSMTNVLKSCKDAPRSGIYNMYFSSFGSTKRVYCDAETDGGGWFVTLRRKDGSVNFTRSWNDYKYGFGNVEGEFWIGNEVLHELTENKPMQLRVDMGDFYGDKAFAKYDRFQIGSEVDKYILSVSKYSGTAGDSLGKADVEDGIHNNSRFVTFDSFNDPKRDGWCVETYPGGWWFNYCMNSHLTAKYGQGMPNWHGIIWWNWKGPGEQLKFVEMKLR